MYLHKSLFFSEDLRMLLVYLEYPTSIFTARRKWMIGELMAQMSQWKLATPKECRSNLVDSKLQNGRHGSIIGDFQETVSGQRWSGSNSMSAIEPRLSHHLTDHLYLPDPFSLPWVGHTQSWSSVLSLYLCPYPNNSPGNPPPPTNRSPSKDQDQDPFELPPTHKEKLAQLSPDIIHQLLASPTLFEPLRRPRFPVVLCHGTLPPR